MITLTCFVICRYAQVVSATGPIFFKKKLKSKSQMRNKAPIATHICHVWAARRAAVPASPVLLSGIKHCLHHHARNQIKAHFGVLRGTRIYFEVPLKLEIMNSCYSYQGFGLIVLQLEVLLPTLQETCLQFTRREWLIAWQPGLCCLENTALDGMELQSFFPPDPETL